MRRRTRRGFSLLEVLLATSILIGSTIVLLELVTIGNRHATSARDLTKSQLICRSKINEFLAKIRPIEPVRPTPLEDDPQWVYWVDLRPLPQEGLVALEVSAAFEPVPQKQSARYSIVRWVRDPQAQGKSAGDTDPNNPAPPDASNPNTASLTPGASGGLGP